MIRNRLRIVNKNYGRFIPRKEIATIGNRRFGSKVKIPKLPFKFESKDTENVNLAPDEVISKYASIPQQDVTLKDLVKFGKPPYDKTLILENAFSTMSRIIVRLAHRLEKLRSLPYLVVLNPHISSIYNLYLTSLANIYKQTPPKTLEENEKFVSLLEDHVSRHSDTIEILSRGFIECHKYISHKEISNFLDEHIRARIGTRLLAEHHISLTNPIADSYIGTVDTKMFPSVIIKHCEQFVSDLCDLKYGQSPKIVIDNGEDISMIYIPVHLEYILCEIFKNAFRAGIENGLVDKPIIVTIVKSNDSVTIRIRDNGGGIPPSVEKTMFNYSYSTYDDNEGDGFSTLNSPPNSNSVAGMGYGLPLSRAYAEYFGGKLDIQTYYGWGTDVYLTLPNLI